MSILGPFTKFIYKKIRVSLTLVISRLHNIHGLDCAILPSLSKAGDVVGTAMYSCYGITKKQTFVYGGLGDMQCSIRSCQPEENEAGMTSSYCYNSVIAIYFDILHIVIFMLKSTVKTVKMNQIYNIYYTHTTSAYSLTKHTNKI